MKNRIKLKLKKIHFKLSDLCILLKISRPTLNKYLKDFDERNLDKIPHSCLLLFNYILDEKTNFKEQVIKFILELDQKKKEVNKIESLEETEMDSKKRIFKLIENLSEKKLEKLEDYIKLLMK